MADDTRHGQQLIPSVGGDVDLFPMSPEQSLVVGEPIWVPLETREVVNHEGHTSSRDFGIVVAVQSIDRVTTEKGPMLHVMATAADGTQVSHEVYPFGNFLRPRLARKAGARSSEDRAADLNRARVLAHQFLEAMGAAGHPGTIRLPDGHSGWEVGVFRHASTPIIDRDTITGSKDGAVVPLYLLVDGRFGIREEPRPRPYRMTWKQRRNWPKDPTLRTGPSPFAPPAPSPDSPLLQLLEVLPGIAAQQGVTIEPWA